MLDWICTLMTPGGTLAACLTMAAGLPQAHPSGLPERPGFVIVNLPGIGWGYATPEAAAKYGTVSHEDRRRASPAASPAPAPAVSPCPNGSCPLPRRAQ